MVSRKVDIHIIFGLSVYVKRTNIVLDERIVEKAQKLTGIRTKRELVDFALKELIRRHEISKLLELEGKIEWDGDLDEMRKARELCES